MQWILRFRDWGIGGFISRGLAIGALSCLFPGACKKAAPAVPNDLTPLQKLVNSDSTLSFFHRTLLRANETALLADASVTLLVPTNEAFRAAGYTEAGLDSLPASFADRLVRYQFIPSRITAPQGPDYTAYTTLSGSSIYGSSDGAQLFFNGIPVFADTASTGNALVYRLGGLLQAPSDSLSQLLAGDTSLTFLAEALRRTHVYDTLLLTGPYTLLAPDNNAFRNAGYDSLPAIDSTDSLTLVGLMRFQVVKGLFFISDLPSKTSLPTLEGPSVAVSVQNGTIQFKGAGNPDPANLLYGDLPVGKGLIVHRIDLLLSP